MQTDISPNENQVKMNGNAKRISWVAGLTLLAALVLSLASVGYPIYVIRPFRAQGERELAAALLMIRYRPLITVICAVAALWAVVEYWRAQSQRWRRIVATLGALLVCGLAVVARVNIFELMFHPVEHPAFAAVGQMKLDKDDKVIAVKIRDTARAYPIRTMGYHHVVNDVVGDTAIVATY